MDLIPAAVKLFELGRLFTGAAARFAGIPRTLFPYRAGELWRGYLSPDISYGNSR